jgi:hypothetical protein
MKTFGTLKAVLENMDKMSWEGTLFTNKSSWASQPDKAEFIYLEGDDEVEDIADGETSLPKLAQENNVQYFLDFQIFQDVIIKQKELKNNSTLDDFIYALNYYREYDSFYWPKN